jgi:hypothetical protein
VKVGSPSSLNSFVDGLNDQSTNSAFHDAPPSSKRILLESFSENNKKGSGASIPAVRELSCLRGGLVLESVNSAHAGPTDIGTATEET